MHNKTIRFNRLDNGLNDLEEADLSIFDCEWQDKTFISCWTKNSSESIPLWRLYSDDGVGVGIGFDSNLFGNPTESGSNYTKYMCNKIVTSNNKEVSPLSFVSIDENSQFKGICSNLLMSKVIYSKNKKKKLNDSIGDVMINGQQCKKIDFGLIGSIKSPIWRFEKEMRFKIFVSDSQNSKGKNEKTRCINDLKPLTDDNKEVKSLYVPIMDKAFSKIEVVLLHIPEHTRSLTRVIS